MREEIEMEKEKEKERKKRQLERRSWSLCSSKALKALKLCGVEMGGRERDGGREG